MDFFFRDQNNILLVSEIHVKIVYKGNKSDFHQAMETDQAKEMYQKFLLKLGQAYNPSKIKDKIKSHMSDLGKTCQKSLKGRARSDLLMVIS